VLSLAEQNALLLRKFPQFKCRTLSDQYAIWTGWVRPAQTRYEIRIEFHLPPLLVLDLPTLNYYPRVYVLEPRLVRQPGADQGPLPHVWYDKEYEGEPNLCLFRPSAADWNYSHSLAETTVPDACEWLYFYELWLVTKTWFGGGEPHTPSEKRTIK
jgi:hypothetical protein